MWTTYFPGLYYISNGTLKWKKSTVAFRVQSYTNGGLNKDFIDPDSGENIARKRRKLGIDGGNAAAICDEFMFFTENLLLSKAAWAALLRAVSLSRDSSNSLILLLDRSSSDSSISSSMLSVTHSAISSDGLFTLKGGCFLSTDFRSAGSFLGVFSWTRQNFVGIDPGFKLTREEPGII